MLVSQSSSKAQQAKGGLNVSVQRCDLGRADQRFEAAAGGGGGGGGGKISLKGSSLCISLERSAAAGAAGGYFVKAKPCADVTDAFTLQQDEELTITKITAGAAQGSCLTETAVQPTPKPGAENAFIFEHARNDCLTVLKTINLPRQARDEHRESTQN